MDSDFACEGRSYIELSVKFKEDDDGVSYEDLGIPESEENCELGPLMIAIDSIYSFNKSSEEGFVTLRTACGGWLAKVEYEELKELLFGEKARGRSSNG